MSAPLVTIVDSAVSASTFASLLAGLRRVSRERLIAGYQTSFWFPFEAQPQSVVEAAVVEALRHIPSAVRRRAVGVEWWLSRTRTSNVKIDFHRDRDNALFDRDGLERHPLLSSVLYVNRCRGGLLAVTQSAPDPRAPALAPTDADYDFVQPRPNRYTFFDGTLTHGVLDANNEVPGRRLPTERTWRVGVAINYWDRAPLDVPRFAASKHFRGLWLGRSASPKGTK